MLFVACSVKANVLSRPGIRESARLFFSSVPPKNVGYSSEQEAKKVFTKAGYRYSDAPVDDWDEVFLEQMQFDTVPDNDKVEEFERGFNKLSATIPSFIDAINPDVNDHPKGMTRMDRPEEW